MFKKILLIIFITIVGYFFISNLKAEIIINDIAFDVDIAFLLNKKIKGLGGKEYLKDNQGMLFLYFNNDVKYFWMKDMNFPIDVLWIKDNRIINISENVPLYTNGETTRMNSIYPTNKVLELKAGTVFKHNIKIDDEIIIKLKTPF